MKETVEMMYAKARCRCEEKYHPHRYVYNGPCIVTGKTVSVEVLPEGLYAYNQGAKMQNAFPQMSSDDREFLMSGMSVEAWSEAFGVDDPEDKPDG